MIGAETLASGRSHIHANFWEKLFFHSGLRDNNSVMEYFANFLTCHLIPSPLPSTPNKTAFAWEGCGLENDLEWDTLVSVQLCCCHLTSCVTLSRLLLFCCPWVLLWNNVLNSPLIESLEGWLEEGYKTYCVRGHKMEQGPPPHQWRFFSYNDFFLPTLEFVIYFLTIVVSHIAIL